MKNWYEQLARYAADGACVGADPQADWVVAAHNPYCGDDLSLYVRLAGDGFAQIRYAGQACQICRASTVILTRELAGRPFARLRVLYERIAAAFDGAGNAPLPEELVVFEAIRAYPVRRQCALLPWQATHAHMLAHLPGKSHD